MESQLFEYSEVEYIEFNIIQYKSVYLKIEMGRFPSRTRFDVVQLNIKTGSISLFHNGIFYGQFFVELRMK